MLQALFTFFIFFVGLALLIFSADFLIRGASSFAKRAGLSPLFIGLTIVAFGTSLPELVVNLFASFKGSNDIAIGNILGSNIANILLILGIAAIIYPLYVKRGTIIKEIPFSLLAVAVLFVLINDALLGNGGSSILSRADGLILLAFFIIFMYYVVSISRASDQQSEEKVKTYSNYVALGMIILGISGLVIGGNLMVDSAITAAQFFGLSEALIGLTVVAVGTSLPELAASAVAVYRRHSDIAIGNIVGSNIFNIFWILGISSLVNPLTFSFQLNIDILVVLVVTILLLLFMFVGKRNILQRWQGATLVGCYFIYIIYLVIRG